MDFNHQGPWFGKLGRASYCSQAIANLIDPEMKMASQKLQRLYQHRSGFSLMNLNIGQGNKDEKFLASIIKKISTRGCPSLCNTELERNILQKCKESGLLDFSENCSSGEIRFNITDSHEKFINMVIAALFPELVVTDLSLKAEMDRRKLLCTQPEINFLDIFQKYSKYPNLVLALIPQRLLADMVQSGYEDQRVDFAIEIPMVREDGWVRIVIEIDDSSHSGPQLIKDRHRDASLYEAGWKVIRLKVGDENSWKSEAIKIIDQLERAISLDILDAANKFLELDEKEQRAILSLIELPLLQAQVLTAIAELIKNGHGSTIRIFDSQDVGIKDIIPYVESDIRMICQIHSIKFNIELVEVDKPECDLLIGSRLDERTWVENTSIKFVTLTFSPVSIDGISRLDKECPRPIIYQKGINGGLIEESLTYFLKQLFRKVEFREKQLDIILAAMAFKPVVGLLPTGAGKSLCYQLPSLLQPGLTIVIDPLRSLMKDQELGLNSFGVHRVKALISGISRNGFNSTQLINRAFTEAGEGELSIIFMAPERLQTSAFESQVKRLSNIPIPFFVVDEAHCISEWGHDFRLSYLHLKRRFDLIAEDNLCKNPGIIALTGTASSNVLLDIVKELDINKGQIIKPPTFDRKELSFAVHQIQFDDRNKEMIRIFKNLLKKHGWDGDPKKNVPSGLIFTSFAKNPPNQKIGVESLKNHIISDIPVTVETYDGSSSNSNSFKESDVEEKKLMVQENFKLNKIPILVCTNAFGMGIDKSNIRFTINILLPRSIEDYYQQAGRAGRDRNPSDCIIIFSDDDPQQSNKILDTERTPIEELKEASDAVSIKTDAVQNTYFLWSNFKGRNVEKRQIQTFLRMCKERKLIDNANGDKISIEYVDEKILQSNDRYFTNIERVLYRLNLVGIILDYVRDYGNKTFEVNFNKTSPESIRDNFLKYVSRYITEKEIAPYLPKSVSLNPIDAGYDYSAALVDFYYDRIVMQRRRALAEMLRLARVGKSSPDRFRIEMLNYLQESKFTEIISRISSTGSIDDWKLSLDLIESKDMKDVGELMGTCIRQLEESPGNPWLLILVGFCRLIWVQEEEDITDLRGGFIALKRLYSDHRTRITVINELVGKMTSFNPLKIDIMISTILEADNSMEIVRHCYQISKPESNARMMALSEMMNNIIQKLNIEG